MKPDGYKKILKETGEHVNLKPGDRRKLVRQRQKIKDRNKDERKKLLIRETVFFFVQCLHGFRQVVTRYEKRKSRF